MTILRGASHVLRIGNRQGALSRFCCLSTACCCLSTANHGDCGCVVGSEERKLIFATEDRKPQHHKEKTRNWSSRRRGPFWWSDPGDTGLAVAKAFRDLRYLRWSWRSRWLHLRCVKNIFDLIARAFGISMDVIGWIRWRHWRGPSGRSGALGLRSALRFAGLVTICRRVPHPQSPRLAVHIGNNKMWTANLGNCRCVVGSEERKLILATEDCKPQHHKEKARSETAGGGFWKGCTWPESATFSESPPPHPFSPSMQPLCHVLVRATQLIWRDAQGMVAWFWDSELWQAMNVQLSWLLSFTGRMLVACMLLRMRGTKIDLFVRLWFRKRISKNLLEWSAFE